MTYRKLSLAACPALLLAGCATPADSDYPSLAVRDIERAEGQFDVGPPQTIDVPAVETPLSGPLPEQLAALVARATEAHRAFTSALPTAERRVAAASGAGIGSDSWAAAQVALADLDSSRSLASVPLGDLDILYAAASVQADDTAAIEAARSQVIALVAEEDAALERLRARVQ
ncbi:hypothetical protein Q9K02_06370 [Qipengyuania sp. G39]|uniref:DUF4398 domain-containing protein n=1 Tax=Qipengyuania profundimaris TaxID=3067652 RepID=A0ABT9HNP2_9SPHN|nr:hypothetical protein [Qipengyuania sp. G39]MDP4574763.1 hypothetical protein [Qipengyuania sp. G39]